MLDVPFLEASFFVGSSGDQTHVTLGPNGTSQSTR